jgi:putative membrane protein
MLQALLRWAVTAAALWVTVQVVHAINPAWATWKGDLFQGLLAVLVMGIVNAIIRPIIKLLTMPITCLTLGLFSLVINAAMFMLVAAVSGAFSVNFIGALIGAILMSLVSGLANALIVGPNER